MSSVADGERAVRMAREAVEFGLSGHGTDPDVTLPFRSATLSPWFDELRGVFVTFTRPGDGQLRGCVGFPFPIYPLRRAIPRAAWAAASEDPRFPPIAKAEISSLVIELSVLTPPERLGGVPDRVGQVSIGRDGLIVEADGASGLLLPQVAVEQGWGAERFLSETCRKAGLPSATWRRETTTVRRFRAELFRERTPGGPVEARDLDAPDA